jgi:nucleotide-binding universal stress UspA family protein
LLEIRTVLCPTDLSDLSARAVDLAASLSVRFSSRLVLQHHLASEPPTFVSRTWDYEETLLADREEKEGEEERRVKDLFATLPAGLAAEARLTRGPLAPTILRLADEVKADLVVMASHDRPAQDHPSCCEQVLAEAKCPILTLHEPSGDAPLGLNLDSPSGPLCAVVPIDFSEHSLDALGYAIALSSTVPLHLHLLHIEGHGAWDDVKQAVRTALPDPLRSQRSPARERLAAVVPPELKGPVTLEVRGGPAVPGILAYAREVNADLLLMGSHPKNVLLKALFGATSSSVLHRSPCPVWFVPAGLSFARSGKPAEALASA